MRIGFVTYKEFSKDYSDVGYIQYEHEPLQRACEELGIECSFPSWDAEEQWSEFDALVIRTTWNYHLKSAAFLE